jgi:hypothetical protein
MKEYFPQFVYSPNRRGGLTWSGALRPTQESPYYSIQVVHDLGRVPRVFVKSPKLDEEAPHRYPDGSLCLYWPNQWRWSPKEFIAETLMPWAALWLYYYEIWLFCGQWCGPSSPHGIPKPMSTGEMT